MQIQLDALSKRFGKVRALDNVSMKIGGGQIVALLGPNGSGKTTLLRCLAAIAAPDRGHILYDGEHFQRARVDLRKRLSFLPDFPLLFPGLTVARHISMILNLYDVIGSEVAPLVTQHLGELDLLPLIDTPIGKLSRGQLYKTALAAMLTINPELWLLDEPFASGMDPGGISYFRKQARAAAARGHSVIYSTQILDVAEKFSDRVCLLYKGKLRLFEAVGNLKLHSEAADATLEKLFLTLRDEER
jgi:ABC-2 type transport system ATP-binding protein